MSDLVCIATFTDLGVARVAQSFLKANGVDALLPDEMVLATQPFLGLSQGGYRLLAPERQRAQAEALLETELEP
jgi:hypothetical protein